MKDNKFIQIAAALGITIPATLLGLAAEAEAKTANLLDKSTSFGITHLLKNNKISDRILNAYNAEESTSVYLLAHTNTHCNANGSHTDQHSNYPHSNQHTDINNPNTCPTHSNYHSNYAAQSSHSNYGGNHTDQHVNRADDC